MANPFLFFIRSSVLSWFGHREEQLAVSDLFNKFSYRYGLRDMHSTLNPFRYLKASYLLLFRKRSTDFRSPGQTFAFGGTTRASDEWEDYLERNGYPGTTVIFRDNLYNELGALDRLVNLFYLLLAFGFILPVTFFRTDRSKISVITLELTELLLLSKTLKKFEVKELFIISAYEKDIVFISYFLKKKLNIRINLLPSSNPITILYKKVICDTFIFTAPFQKAEYEILKENWFVKETKSWPPYGFSSIKINHAQEVKNEPFTLGLMSSGTALRVFLGHTNHSNNNDFLAEQNLIKAIKRLKIETNLIDKLIIYLHPLEKANEKHLQFSTNYYKEIFFDFEFAPFDMPSKHMFGLCSVGVSGFSSAQIERLYGGYKTIFAPMGFLNNYFSDPRLDSISVCNYTELKDMVEIANKLSSDEFFEKFNLKDYKWESYPALHQHPNNTMISSTYTQCTRCVMDAVTDQNFALDQSGVCNYCLQFDEVTGKLPQPERKQKYLDRIILELKEAGIGKRYDCILGVSGGVDSTYLAYWCRQNGVRPLLVHLDNGWDSELAMKNIENICSILNFELYTHVINWNEFKELQLAYLRAGVVDMEVLTDHAIYAILINIAKRYSIKYILSGFNLVTESVMPKGWVYDKTDWKNIRDIYSKFGNKKQIRTFPHIPFFYKLYNYWFMKLEVVQVLNYLNYNQTEAKRTIERELNWIDCGGKHYESLFTKFYQTYILPEKFKIDKRKAHLSTLICSGQITREKALLELEKPPYNSTEIEKEITYVLKKWDLSRQSFDKLIKEKPRSHLQFKTEKKLWENYFKLIKLLRPWKTKLPA